MSSPPPTCSSLIFLPPDFYSPSPSSHTPHDLIPKSPPPPLPSQTLPSNPQSPPQPTLTASPLHPPTSHLPPASSTGRVSVRSSPDPSDARRAKARTGKHKASTRGACCNGHCQARLPYNAPICTQSGQPMHAYCAQPGVSPPICTQCYAIPLDLTDI
jgi:hypothetical protein